MTDLHLAQVQITANGDGTHRLIVNGHDLSMLAERVTLFVDSETPVAAVWIPAEAAVDIPADLTIFVDQPSTGVAQALIEQIERENFETESGYLNNFEPWQRLKGMMAPETLTTEAAPQEILRLGIDRP